MAESTILLGMAIPNALSLLVMGNNDTDTVLLGTVETLSVKFMAIRNRSTLSQSGNNGLFEPRLRATTRTLSSITGLPSNSILELKTSTQIISMVLASVQMVPHWLVSELTVESGSTMAKLENRRARLGKENTKVAFWVCPGLKIRGDSRLPVPIELSRYGTPRQERLLKPGGSVRKAVWILRTSKLVLFGPREEAMTFSSVCH